MLNKNTKDILPKDINFFNAEWYKNLTEKYEYYRYTLLRIVLLTASSVPVLFAIIDLIEGSTAFLPYYLGTFVFFIMLFIVLLHTGKTAQISKITLIIGILSFVYTLYSPNSKNVSLLIFFCFPPIAFQLSGTRKGAWWILVFVAVSISVFVLNALGRLPQLNSKFPNHENILLAFIATILVSIITYFGERQHEKEINLIIRNILFDETTKLPNKKVLVHSIKKNTRYLFSIILIENFNDLGLIFGYDLSDRTLQFVADQLKLLKKKFNFTVFWLKGNEFGILLPLLSDDKEEAHLKMTNIRHHLQSNAMPWENSELRLNIHIGGVMVDSCDHDKSTDMLSKADMALKSSVENHAGVTLFENHEHLKANAMKSINIFSTLYKNHEDKSYKAYFQPIIHASTGDIVWYESLLRIRNDEGAYESPVKYLSIAESTGYDIHLTRFMLDTACRALRHAGAHVSVNITFQDMIRPEFIESLIRHHQNVRPGNGRLILEILERSELSEIEACDRFIRIARGLGCLIAIDDFGCGYSNLNNILTLPVDIVKINGALIQQWHENAKARNLIEKIISFCKQTGMLIAAEWVDSQLLADELKAAGVDYLQGFHFEEPREMLWDNPAPDGSRP